MEIVTGIVGKVAEYAIEPAIRRVGYLTHCRSSLQNLQTQVKELTSAREGVEHKVDEAERQGKRIEGEVQNWLKQVDEITGKAGELWKDEIQAKMNCLHGFCPNLILRYQLSRKSKKLEQVAVKLYEKRDFSNFSYDARPQEVCTVSTKYYEAFDSRISTLKNIMDELRAPSTDLIVVYGIGGVGKTTLVEEVLRQAVAEKLFTDAVMVRDVKNPDLQGIKKEIAKKLGMEVGENEIMAERVCSRIKDKKVLVILDNIWEKIDLETVGLPCLSNCKILLTSRNLKFLSSEMRPQKEFRLEVLNEKETWSLFEKKAGDVVKDHAIRNIAIQVSEKCGGLPVLVVTVASALRNRSTLYAWNDALRCLKAFEGEESTEEAYSALEWSFNQLDSKLKPLFLLCGIVIGVASANSAHLSHAHLSDLFKYAMGLGWFKNCHSLEQASNALHSWIEQLKDSCLLLDNVGDEFIRMHDLVHNVAITIASKDQCTLFRTSGGELKEWPNDRDFLEKCTTISLAHCNIPRLPEVFECQNLEMFILGSNGGDPVEIPDTFFKGMIKLKVLDLTILNIGSLPSSLQLLENLRTLCLGRCVLGDIALVGQLTRLEILSFADSDLKELPKEIGKLTHLRLLDLGGCYQLEVISPNVLSSLKSLEDLRIHKSFHRWVAEGVTGERSNASLLELKDLPHLEALAVHIPDASIMPRGLFSDKLKRYDISIGDTRYTFPLTVNFKRTNRYGIRDSMDGTLNTLKLKLTTRQELDDGLKMLLKRSEALYLHGLESDFQFQSDSEDFQQLKHLYVQNIAKFTYIINEKVVLPNLTRLIVCECGSRFLFSSSTARNLVQLKYLEVKNCYMMEEIVSTQEYGEENAAGMFCKLQRLKLTNLQILSRFCSGSYIEFPSLESLEIVNCNVLETFICEPRSKSITVRRETKEDLKKTVVQYFLFDDKVGFPRLESLFIHGLNKLTAIWHNQHVPGSLCGGDNTKEKHEASAQNLVTAVIWKCSNLQYILYCPGIEEIIAKVEGVETTPEFVFPKVVSFILDELPQLKRFYPGIHASKWPLLEELIVRGCDQLDIFSVELPSFQKHVLGGVSAPIKQPLFLIEKDSFPKLETLVLDGTMEICGDLLPAEVFRKLKYVEFRAPYSTVETSHEQGRSAKITLEDVSARKIQGSGRLRHLWKENSPSACPVFPSLEILRVWGCIRLQDLVTSAISFQNLTTLKVVGCHRLKSLTNYSVAKTLMQLREMTLANCKRMIKIVETSDGEDAAGNEIAFSRLLHLELSSLPSLKDFCSGNCIVKFPQLKTFSVRNCPKLKTSSELERISQLTPPGQFDGYFDFAYNRFVDGDDDDDDDVEMVPENSI
ncbi:unnamed protein product [Malus baccata var. baccata]